MTKDFYSVKELAKHYGITQHTVRKLVKAGRLPTPLRVGRSIRWDLDDITAWEKTAKEVKN